MERHEWDGMTIVVKPYKPKSAPAMVDETKVYCLGRGSVRRFRGKFRL